LPPLAALPFTSVIPARLCCTEKGNGTMHVWGTCVG
jgi:hypothetical protein